MKKFLLPLALIIAGIGVGAGSGYGAGLVLGSPDDAHGAQEAVKTSFVPVPHMVAPLVLPDGRLSGYMAFEVQLEVPEKDVDSVTQRIPFVQHAINLRTYRTPLAAGVDGTIPDIEKFRQVVADAAKEALGQGVVQRVAVTKAVPD
ncbi:hypothetical protein [Stakelama pacifica]|uniref:Uncharacterized protein n=1 Tax=Stakelama pacifica TaxID=517720 RepID=A0A4R6FIC9_9SPHN|nr:hypothetical protein [Stakelama pacifica]TDN81136.1 hypothetical protein EV664_10878 [Stakelama pacifica]GGO96858.1 hypothetical protein GCM10011329_24350 [Stakelama pacifica]